MVFCRVPLWLSLLRRRAFRCATRAAAAWPWLVGAFFSGGLVLGLPTAGYGQVFLVESRPVALDTYRRAEQRRGAHAWPESPRGAGSAFAFRRPVTERGPQLLVRYAYALPDSVVHTLTLELDSTNFLPRTHAARLAYQEPPERLPDFTHAYARLRAELVALLGKPHHSQPLRLERTLEDGYYGATDAWETENATAELELVFTTKALPPHYPTYRIRATLEYASPVQSSPLAFSANPRQVAVGQRYVSLLAAQQFRESWALVGPEMKDQRTYAQYEALLLPLVAPVAGRAKGVACAGMFPLLSATGPPGVLYIYSVQPRRVGAPPLVLHVLFRDPEALLISEVRSGEVRSVQKILQK